MAELVMSVDVAAPAAATFAAMTDWARQGEWMPGTTVRATVGTGRGVGEAIAARTAVGPVGFLDTMTITAWDEPARVVMQHTGRLVRGAGAFEVVRRGPAGSTFVWSEWLDLPAGRLGQLGWVLAVRPLSRVALRVALRRFARWTESRYAAGDLPAL